MFFFLYKEQRDCFLLGCYRMKTLRHIYNDPSSSIFSSTPLLYMSRPLVLLEFDMELFINRFLSDDRKPEKKIADIKKKEILLPHSYSYIMSGAAKFLL